MRTAVTFGLIVGALGCGTPKECRDLPVKPVDEARGCLGANTGEKIRACLDPDEHRGTGLFVVCVADNAGRLFVAFVSSNDWIDVPPGWTHSETPREPSTLSVEDERRCERAPDPFPKATCP
jgi:hypothetical protein